MSYYDTVIHLVAGGLGGTAGAIATCPLEVLKTRLQSSVATFTVDYASVVNSRNYYCVCASAPGGGAGSAAAATAPLAEGAGGSGSGAAAFGKPEMGNGKSFGIWRCLKYIIETEGTRALFKGLGPNLVGVAPSRAIYFCTYSHTKGLFNDILTPDTPLVHICSAANAGFMSCTLTNPLWFVKTRLQLDQRKYGSVTTLQCIRDIYKSNGVTGFYKGMTASYFGISETIVHFVLYEFIKAKLREYHEKQVYDTDHKSPKDFAEFMCAGAISKTCASILAYPHEVARTRLRQEGNKYRSFFQTLFLVYREEGTLGLYRGLATQLVRQIPNTAIMMATYEAVVYLLSTYQCGGVVPTLQLCASEEDVKEPC